MRSSRPMVAVAALLSGLVSAAAQPAETPLPFVTTQGAASAEVTPDSAQLSIGVQVERPSAAAATADVARAAQAIVDQIKADGIDDQDVATAAVALSPIAPDDTAPRANRPSRGFAASTELVVTIRPPERAGVMAAHLVDKGANTIEGIAYASSREQAVLDGLRADAMRDARRKAEIYVGALGLHLGRVLEIVPGGEGGGPRPVAFAKARSIVADATPPLPVKPGTLTERADVSVRWEIVP